MTDSPSAVPTPAIIEPTSDTQNMAGISLQKRQIEMTIKLVTISPVTMKIRDRCCMLIKYLALTILVSELKTMRDLGKTRQKTMVSNLPNS